MSPPFIAFCGPRGAMQAAGTLVTHRHPCVTSSHTSPLQSQKLMTYSHCEGLPGSPSLYNRKKNTERPAESAVLEMFHSSDQKTAISAGYQFKYCSTANCVALSMQ
jgi:hypothetical protein